MSLNMIIKRIEALDALKKTIARLTERGELYTTAVSGLSLYRREQPSEPVSGMYEPSICMVVQGSKYAKLGADTLVYDAERYLITSVHLPSTFQIMEASPDKPYLGLRLTFDQRELAQLMADSHLPPPQTRQSSPGMAVGQVTPELLDAVYRLVSLLEHEADIPVMAPLIHREILYRLLTGELGPQLRQIAAAGSQSRQIADAINWLKNHYAESLRIDDLAAQAGMSSSTFHHHFRAMTALSPLQYQKRLRLQEARRLMLAEHLDASTAGFQVGYESPSQFSREYSRLFGAPPLRDITSLRGRVEAS